MFEVGFTELLLIFALALVVLGPEKLPRVANQVGRWIGRARAMARQFREQLEDETILQDTPPPRKPAAPAPNASPPPAAATPAGTTTTADAAPTDVEATPAPPREKYYQPEDDVARADVSHADAGAEPDVDTGAGSGTGTRAGDERGT